MKKMTIYVFLASSLWTNSVVHVQAIGIPSTGTCLAQKALSGDPVAARNCASMNLKRNQNLLRYWTQIAAENGDTVSQYNFAIMLLVRNNQHDKTRAIYWLKIATEKGFAPAKQVLDDVRLNPNSTFPLPPSS